MEFQKKLFYLLILLLAQCGNSASAVMGSASPFRWARLANLPDKAGLAGAFAGVSNGALIVAGGANFPTAMPWEGGKKVWHTAIYVLKSPDGKWRIASNLPSPLAYGVSVTIPQGVLCAGGGNAASNSCNVFLLRWTNGQVKTRLLPSLPRSMADGCGAVIGTTLYLAGGIETPNATRAMKTFWALDLSAPQLHWQKLDPWPGPERILPVAGAVNGAFYLFSGALLHAGENGKPVRKYLRDAYRYKPGAGWKKICDLPRPAVAAPSPAIAWHGQLLIVSGDDGKLVNFEPKSKHPGFPKNVLAYHPGSDKWTPLGDSPLSRATAPVVTWQRRAIVINGEVHPGVRTPEVWSLKLP